MRRKETREISGVQYAVVQVGGNKCREVLVRAVKILGPALKSLQGARGPDVLAAIGTLATELKEEDLTFFCQTFAPLTEYSTDGGVKWPRLDRDFDEHFAGDRMLDQFKWLAFCLELNLASFFGGADALKTAFAKLLSDPEKGKDESSST